jgi:hypothetical protein
MFIKYHNAAIALLAVLLLQGCVRISPDVPPTFVTPTARQIESQEIKPTASAAATKIASTPTRTVTPTATHPPEVTITAVDGNLYIRRGPGMAYNQIDVLLKGETARALYRDILSKWVQINIPGHPDQTGWISLMTKYSSINGDLSAIPAIQVTDWPVAAYLRNCSFHRMLVMPGGTVIPSLLQYPENEVWIYPGSYTVFDYDMPDTPEVMRVEIREGYDIEILYNGAGEKHKCP